MNKIRKLFNKPKKEVENQLMIQPLTPERRHDVPVVMETLGSSFRDLDQGSVSQTRTDGSDPDLILDTRLSMLRELLQRDASQEQEVPLDSPGHLNMSTWTPHSSAPLPVLRSLLQVEQVTGTQTDTGSGDIISHHPAGGGATQSSASSPGLPVRPFLKTRDDCSLPSSPRLGRRRGRLPCSLPCSPLLEGRRWRSPLLSPSPPSSLSRLLVEAALQRSKNIWRPPPCPPQVRQEGEGVRRKWGETGEEGEEEEEEEEEEWSDDEKEEDKQVNETRLSDAIIFRPTTPPRVCGREEEEEEGSDLLCLDSEVWRYCQLTPCVCFRCPSAPPYEPESSSPGNVQTVSSFTSEDQKHGEGLALRTDLQRSEGYSERSLPRDGAPQLGEGSRLYPRLSLWRITVDSQLLLLNPAASVQTQHHKTPVQEL